MDEGLVHQSTSDELFNMIKDDKNLALDKTERGVSRLCSLSGRFVQGYAFEQLVSYANILGYELGRDKLSEMNLSQKTAFELGVIIGVAQDLVSLASIPIYLLGHRENYSLNTFAEIGLFKLLTNTTSLASIQFRKRR